jgi:hypothetical protein
MTIPTIHPNGTSRDTLIDALCAASSALDKAYAALKQTAPNGRDYYPQGADAMDSATREHMDRLRRVDVIKDEIDELTRAVARA